MTHTARTATRSLLQKPPSFALLPLVLAAASGCAQTHHAVAPADLGQPTSWAALEQVASLPGPVHFEKHVAADWAVDLSGMLNLDHPGAAHLEDRSEPIQVYLYVIEHPQAGTFLIDSGVARSFAEGSSDVPVRWPVSWAMPLETLQVRLDTASYLASRERPIDGVFLTHLHLDHVLGLCDVPKDVPLYVGPGEDLDRRLTHLLTRATTEANLEGFGALRTWQVSTPDDGQLGVVDVFGDQTVFGLHAPGHTSGNMAFLIRSTNGPQLVVGDASHTAFGWEHGIEPGTFNTDGDQAAQTLAALRRLSQEHPALTVHLGHQPLGGGPEPVAAPAVASGAAR